MFIVANKNGEGEVAGLTLREATKRFFIIGPATKALPPALELSGHIFLDFFFEQNVSGGWVAPFQHWKV